MLVQEYSYVCDLQRAGDAEWRSKCLLRRVRFQETIGRRYFALSLGCYAVPSAKLHITFGRISSQLCTTLKCRRRYDERLAGERNQPRIFPLLSSIRRHEKTELKENAKLHLSLSKAV